MLLAFPSRVGYGLTSASVGNIRRLSPDLDRIVPPGAVIEKVGGNLPFAEGPVWLRNGGYLLFSDIPANAIMKWTPEEALTVFRKPMFGSKSKCPWAPAWRT